MNLNQIEPIKMRGITIENPWRIKKIKILYISKTSILSKGGGAEYRTDQITRDLVDRGHEILLISAKTDLNLRDTFEDEGRTIVHIKCVPDLFFKSKFLSFYLVRYLFPILSFPTLLYFLKEEQFDLVIECMSPYPTFAIFASKLTSTPIIAEQHGFFTKEHYNRYGPITVSIQLIIQNFLRLFDYNALIVPSNHLKRQFNEYGIDDDKIFVVPNGINNNQKASFKDFSGVNGDLLFLGRLAKTKGLIFLLDSFECLLRDSTLDTGYDLRFHIAGEGLYRKDFEREVNRRGLDDVVVFHGFVEGADKKELFDMCDLFIFASPYESFGIVILEAMSWGLPVVARKLPVYNDFFTNKQNGFLIRKGEKPIDFSKAVNEILKNEEMYEKFSRNNIEASKHFHWENIVSNLEELYCSLKSLSED